MGGNDTMLFYLAPCPICGHRLNVHDDAGPVNDIFCVAHQCTLAADMVFTRHGQNMRQAVQRWNNSIKELTAWIIKQKSPM